MQSRIRQRQVSLAKIGAIYGRVSVDEAAEVEHGSLEQQRHMGKDMASKLSASLEVEHRIEYELIEVRGVSGGNTNRPKYQELLTLIRTRKIDFVIAKEISRLSRSLRDFCEFLDLCRTNSVSVYIRGLEFDPNSPMGSMMFKLIALLAEFERQLIVQRTKDTIRSAAVNNGKVNGGSLPLGLDRHPEKKGYRIPNHDELRRVEFLMRTFLQTGSLKETIGAARRAGIKKKNGSEFGYNSIRILLTNIRYIGKQKVKCGDNDEHIRIVPAAHGPVIDIDLFEKVQSRYAKLAEEKNLNRNIFRVYPLSGLLKHEDGSVYRGTSGTGRNGKRRFYYKNSCRNETIPADDIEDAILTEMRKVFQDNAQLKECIDKVKTENFSRREFIEGQIECARAERRNLQKDDSVLFEKLRTSSASDATIKWLEDQLNRKEQVRKDIDARLASLEHELVELGVYDLDNEKVGAYMSWIFKMIQKAEPVRKKELMRNIFKSVVVCTDDTLKIHWAIPGCDFGGTDLASSKVWGG